jgi:hypothetical protein
MWSHLAFAAFVFAGPTTADDGRIRTGLQAPDVAPLVHGIVTESVHTLVFAGCFLALDDNATCIDIAGKARDDVAER